MTKNDLEQKLNLRQRIEIDDIRQCFRSHLNIYNEHEHWVDNMPANRRKATENTKNVVDKITTLLKTTTLPQEVFLGELYGWVDRINKVHPEAAKLIYDAFSKQLDEYESKFK